MKPETALRKALAKAEATLDALRDLLGGAPGGDGGKVGLRSEGKYIFITVDDPERKMALLGLLADLRDKVR